MKKLSIKNILYVIQGAVVGMGAILPGISGGVLCVAFGIYEPMMAMLSHPRKSFKKYYKIFIPFLIGWVVGFVLLANVVKLLFSASSTIALMLFFGLICGTLPELFKKAEISNRKMSWSPFIIALSLSYFLLGILEQGNGMNITLSFWSYAVCGIIWGMSLVVPGLSSSSILIYMGLYEPMTAGIAALDFSVILPLLLGLLVTGLSLARVINTLFESHYALVSRIILGVVIASSLKIVPTVFESTVTIIVSVICFIIGFAVARYMDKTKSKNNTAEIKTAEGRKQ